MDTAVNSKAALKGAEFLVKDASPQTFSSLKIFRRNS